MGRPMMKVGTVFCLLIGFCVLLPSFIDAGTSAASNRDDTALSEGKKEVERRTLDLVSNLSQAQD